MKRVIQVCLGAEALPIGLLHYESAGNRERSAFVYHDAWISGGFPIEPGIPLQAGPHYHHPAPNGSVFHAIVADTEPDGWARRVILRDCAKRRRTGSDFGRFTAIDFLLAVDDESRIGALRFKDEDGRFCRLSGPGERSAPPLIELSKLLASTRAVETETETEADLEYLRGRATSLGGMRPKCTVRDEDGWLSVGKFPSVQDERAVTKAEVLAMQLAKEAGIRAAETRLVFSDRIPVLISRRFDRTADGARILYASAATLLGADSTMEHSYTEMVDGIRLHGAEVQADIEELWRRIAFSILITNVDDHLHNHGFLHASRGQWRLAPAFDLNPFPDRARELKTWISEETGPEASIESLFSAIAYFRISRERAGQILAEVERAVAGWRKKGAELQMSDRELESLEEAFEHEERVAARRMIGS